MRRSFDLRAIAALPASWYAARPIPPRLAVALAHDVPPAVLDRAARRLGLLGRAPLSAVERAHVRATNRLARKHR